MGHEMEQTQQYFRILQGGRLLQKDETVDHRKISCSQPRTPALHLAIQSRPCLWNLFEQLRDRTLHGAGMAEIDTHPIGGGEFFAVGCPDFSSSGFVLGLPAQRVVIAPLAEMQETARGHQEIERRFQLLSYRSAQRRGIGPVVQLVHG